MTAEDDRRERGSRRKVLGRDSGEPAVQKERFLQDLGERRLDESDDVTGCGSESRESRL